MYYGSSATYGHGQQQPHFCRHGSANEWHSFCYNDYMLMQHDLQWQ